MVRWRKEEEEGARNPATTIMKKVTDEDAGSTNNGHNSKGAAARPPIGEGDCPTFLSPPVRHQRRRRSGEDFVGRSKWKKKRKGEYSGLPCSHHNRDGDEDAGDTDNGHSSRGVVARPSSVHPDTTDYRYYTIIYILGEEDRLTFLSPLARCQRRRGRV